LPTLFTKQHKDTQVEEITITISTHDGTMVDDATLPTDFRISELKNAIIEKFQVPKGNYFIALKRTLAQLNEEQTLAEAGVQNGDTLKLTPLPHGGK
jgi:hypothetical protein